MSAPLRLGVIGLGMMGRHHARIARTIDDVEFVGGADPAGDTHRALGGAPVFSEVDGLLAAGVDAVVVSTPSHIHEEIAVHLAGRGVHTLIEKPLSDTLESAIRIRDAFAGTGLVAAVGHVERFNPAMQSLKRRLEANELGSVISISTRRVGPNPGRVRDVGVVKDLATHDIDLVLWLGGSIDSMWCQLARPLGRVHEDLLEAIGQLRSGVIMSLSVNWVTPTKERSVKVLGERGALVADLLTADLTFFSNADVAVEWEAIARIKGVSEGDMIRYALHKPEPLQAELAAFCGAVRGLQGSDLATLDQGVEVIRTAELLLEMGRR